MKKLIVFEINDGLDGIILAKSLKHAIKKLAPVYGYPVKDFMDSIRKGIKARSSGDWSLTYCYKEPKKGKCRKSKILGWYEW